MVAPVVPEGGCHCLWRRAAGWSSWPASEVPPGDFSGPLASGRLTTITLMANAVKKEDAYLICGQHLPRRWARAAPMAHVGAPGGGQLRWKEGAPLRRLASKWVRVTAGGDGHPGADGC